MLAVFNKSVANGPEALISPSTRRSSSDLVAKFLTAYQDVVCMKFDDVSCMAYTHEGQTPTIPRLFAAMDDIFCLFDGKLDNLAGLRQQYGLSKTVNDVLFVIEAYRALRDRAPYPAARVVADLCGQFAFVLYDNTTRTIFVAADPDGKVPFYWGTTSDGSLAFSDDDKLLKECCGRSCVSFPQGCYFSSVGLKSYEHPSKEVKVIQQIDGSGQMCGATFKVDIGKDEPRLPNANNKTKDHVRAWGMV